MNKVAVRSGIVLALALVLIAGMTFFIAEYTINADQWVTFSGSPHVYNGGNIGCGVVTDRNGVLLLDMNDGRTYSSDDALRASTVHWVGDKNGSVNAPALSTYSAELTGFELLNGVYSYGGKGGVAKLTLSAEVQTSALEAMGQYKGTVAVYNYKTGEIICAVSTPVFDPDNIPELTEEYEGMYLNRFVQSTYAPGSIFKIVTLAAALESIPDIQEQTFTCKGSMQIGPDTITCTGKHWNQDLKTAFRNSCNCAFAQIAQQLGRETLTRYAEQFGITEQIEFDGITTAEGKFDLTDAYGANLAWSAIGQYTDMINPCAYLTFVGSVASGGKGVQPHIVQQVGSGGISGYTASAQKRERIMSASTASVVAEYMGYNVTDKYGSENFPGMTVCAKTGTAEVGGGKKPNAVFTGFVTNEEYPLAFLAIVEDGGYGSEVCIPIVKQVLAACKEADLK